MEMFPQHGASRPLRSVWVALRAVAVGAVLVAACAGCGSSTASNSTTSPAKRASITFHGLPQYAGSTPVGHPNVNGSATTQTFTVVRASPRQVVQFYSRALAGWTVVEKPHALTSGSQSAWRGRFKRGNATLLVSAESTPSPNQEATQYSLDLRTS